MNCLNCNCEMKLVDTTYSNVNTEKCNKGDKTGDIYYCKKCDTFFIDDYLRGEMIRWIY